MKLTHHERVEAFGRIRDALYASRQWSVVMDCPKCGAAGLEARLETAEERGTLYVQCKSCGWVDHMSRLELPEWAKQNHERPSS